MGIRGAGQCVSLVVVVGTASELYAGVLEGLGQRSGNSLRRQGVQKFQWNYIGLRRAC